MPPVQTLLPSKCQGAHDGFKSRYGDGGGLYLVVTGKTARKWVFHFTCNGKVTEMGLGSAADVSLSDARSAAGMARKALLAGANPIEHRRNAEAAAAAKPTFGQIADELLQSK
jgi:hypothetical protein